LKGRGGFGTEKSKVSATRKTDDERRKCARKRAKIVLPTGGERSKNMKRETATKKQIWVWRRENPESEANKSPVVSQECHQGEYKPDVKPVGSPRNATKK